MASPETRDPTPSARQLRKDFIHVTMENLIAFINIALWQGLCHWFGPIASERLNAYLCFKRD